MSLINTNVIPNKFPYAPFELLKDYPWYNVYQPLPSGIYEVIVDPLPPPPEKTHFYNLSLPIEIDGVWVQQWVLQEHEFGVVRTGPGPWDLDKESGKFYLSNPLARAE